MKLNSFKLPLIAIATLLAAACGSNSKTNVSGDIETNSDSIIVRSILLDRSEADRDTIALDNGHFDIKVNDSVPVWVNIMPMPRNEEERKTTISSKLLMLPGDNIKLSGSLEDLKISGSKLYDALEGTEFYELYKENDALRREMSKVFRTINDENRNTLDSLLDLSQEMDKKLNLSAMALVKKQPGNIASGFATLKMFDKDCMEAMQILHEDVINGPMKLVIESNVTAKQKSMEKQKEWDKITAGMQAPDFKLKDLNGEEKTLASFKGKYVALEFWGTWCPWCIKGLPMMRTYYAKYKSDIEFVSVCCRDTDEAWRKCVEKNDLRWTQLFNGDNKEILKYYGILGFPSKIIIDKEGKIVEKYLDEEDTFYQKLDELFGK